MFTKERFSFLRVTRHLCFKNSKNLRPQDILAFNLADKPSFKNPIVLKNLSPKSITILRGLARFRPLFGTQITRLISKGPPFLSTRITILRGLARFRPLFGTQITRLISKGPPFLSTRSCLESIDIVKNIQLIHSNRLNHEPYSEPS